jgi:allophanate hydrolase
VGGTSDSIAAVYDRLEAEPLQPIWISRVPRQDAADRARAAHGPLRGLTFAVKDNIDVVGLPTTAACPEFAYQPASSASVVTRLERAGAVLVGKTNMDQFATGLVGTRTPYGACSSVFDAAYISGGSSSGSAVAVARGLVDFALGTDTAGSGRVPAAFNNLVGLKPTRGVLSTQGVLPACRTLDCVSVFSRTVRLARQVFEAARGFDPDDPFSRCGVARPLLGSSFRFGVPERLEFFGDAANARLYDEALAHLTEHAGTAVRFDAAVLVHAAHLLYGGPWVAERYAAIRPFIEQRGEAMDPVVRGIISGATRFSAADAFEAEYQRTALKRRADALWDQVDVLALPTAPTIYTHAEIAADPVRLNTNLGYYTNFVNLLDMAAIAIPAGFRPDGLPFGVTLIGPAFADELLLDLAARLVPDSVHEHGVPE